MIEQLRNTGGDALVRRMLRLFLVTSADAFRRIDTALDSGTLPVVAAAAHHLHASAAQLRFTDIATIAERIANTARAGSTASLHDDVAVLSAALGTVVGALHDELEKLPKPARIAVIDDSEDVRVLVRLVLERQYDVAEYATGSAALAALQRFPVELLIIDLNLPDMSGIDLLNFIKADHRLCDIPAIALTALTPEEGKSYLDAGFDMHVRKPVLDTDELLAAIGHLLNTEPGEWT
jgi:CheY-like chemotaxis protein